jgi:hypothetical protein
MAKTIRTGTAIRVKTIAGKMAHAIVKTVTSQDELSVSVGHGTAFNVTRGASTTTRGTIFSE